MVSTSSTRSVIVTGGASGIGLAITRHFASQSHHVAVLDVDASTGPTVIETVSKDFPHAKLAFHHCDVSNWDNQVTVFREVFEQHDGHIDVVCANAGVSDRGANGIELLDEAEPSRPSLTTVNINLVGLLYTIKLAAYYMNKNPASTGSSRGTIICTASNAGLYPFPVAPVYSATKAGVIGLVRSLALPYAKHNIQINALAPAVLETNIAPTRDLFSNMILTPFTTITRGVHQFIDDPSMTGEVAEIHGESVTIRPHLEIVDEDSGRNLEEFWRFGRA